VIQRWETDTRPGTTQAGEFNTEIRNTRRPRLFDDKSRFQNIKNKPMLFPTNPVWFRRGSYADPLAGDVGRLAPLIEWSGPPVGRPGADGERVPQPQQSRLRFQESSQPDDWCEARQSEGGTQREGPPRSSGEVDLQNVINGPRHKRKFPTRDQPRTQGRYEPSSKGMDQNEHRTRRHKYELTRPFHHSVSLTDRVERPDSMSGPHGCFFLFKLKYGISLPFLQGKDFKAVCIRVTLRT
jgi:hypothetical protein